jgi:hypothetical protein
MDKVHRKAYGVTSEMPMLIWFPVTTAWRVLGLRLEEAASRYGQLRIY